MTHQQKTPEIYLSMPHPCSYLPGRMASSLFIDPHYPLDSLGYAGFMQLGFRRSGDLIYRPHCHGCHACIPVRVPVNLFCPNRGQRRVWQRNRDITVVPKPPGFDEEHFQLYQRYQALRHPGGGMDDPDPQKYKHFLTSKHIDSMFCEFRREDQLLGVAVVDVLPDGLSAVYTFFDPGEKQRALGVYAALWEIEETKRRGLPWLYLGYLIQECPKMSYKANYRPLEAYRDGRWALLEN